MSDSAESASVRGWLGSVLKKQQRDLKRFLSKVRAFPLFFFLSDTLLSVANFNATCVICTDCVSE